MIENLKEKSKSVLRSRKRKESHHFGGAEAATIFSSGFVNF
jgi:hypothetical protein